MKSIIRFWLCVLLVTGHASATPFNEGVAAYELQDYATALKLWLPLAEQGHRSAQFNVGIIYEKGLGVPQDAAQAARWYLRAAEKGDVQAQYNIGVFYETGAGLPKDLAEARKWYRVVMANPSNDAETLEIKRDARARLAASTSATEEVMSYSGGRFVIARSSDGACIVALQGPITASAVSLFDDVIRKSANLGCTNPWLLLESPGGMLFDGIELGVKVRRAGFRTTARSTCASACALIFLGGTERMLVGSSARIGFHQASIVTSRGTDCDKTTYTSAATEMSDYVKSVIPAQADQVIELIRQTPCDKIEWIQGDRAVSLGVATRLESAGVAGRP